MFKICVGYEYFNKLINEGKGNGKLTWRLLDRTNTVFYKRDFLTKVLSSQA